MAIINTTNLNEVRKQIQKIKKENSEEIIIVKAYDEEFNRKILEMKGVNVLLSPELHYGKDRMKQRDSGLNEFLCRLAAKNKIKVAVDIGGIQRLEKKEKAKALARAMQNIKLCKRTGARLILWPENKYKKQDVMGFFLSLKASSQQAKNISE